MGSLKKILRGKRGAQMVEAAISLPIIILAAMLMVRMFVFYIEILTSGIAEHKEAMMKQDSYNGAFIRTYKDSSEVDLLKGGLLLMNVSKRLETKAYLINEDVLARSGGVID